MRLSQMTCGNDICETIVTFKVQDVFHMPCLLWRRLASAWSSWPCGARSCSWGAKCRIEQTSVTMIECLAAAALDRSPPPTLPTAEFRGVVVLGERGGRRQHRTSLPLDLPDRVSGRGLFLGRARGRRGAGGTRESSVWRREQKRTQASCPCHPPEGKRVLRDWVYNPLFMYVSFFARVPKTPLFAEGGLRHKVNRRGQ